MKKTIVAFSLVAVTSLMASDALRTEIDLTAGYNKFDSASKLDSATLFGIRATVFETEVNKYGLQVGYEGAMGVGYEGVAGTETDIHRLFTHLVVDGESEYGVTPYLFLGGGYEYLSDEIKGEPSQGFIDLGLGFKYFFENGFKVLAEGKAIGKFETRDLEYQAAIGVGYMFGGAFNPQVKPLIALGEKKLTEEVPEKLAPVKKRNITVIRVPVEETITDVVNAPTYDSYDGVISPLEEVATYTSTSEVVAEGSYYVQMAALEKTPTAPLVENLHTNGYMNTLVHPRGSVNLVLVGPYETSKEASRAQGALRSVRPDAFVYKMQ